MGLCKCGCQELIREDKRYVKGHRYKLLSDESKKKMCWNKGLKGIKTNTKGRVQSEKEKSKRSYSVKTWWSNNSNKKIQQNRNKKISDTRNKKFTFLWTARECHYCGSIFRINIKNIYLSNWGKYCSKICKCQDQKGTPPWNKGLSKKTDNRLLVMSVNRSLAGNVNGEKHWNWRGGITFEPYSKEFNRKLKIIIKERDGCKCQECGVPEREEHLFIHHVDYNKKNNSKENLITLCNSCHGRTNGKRDKWVEYFKFKISQNKSIPAQMVIR